MKNMIFALVLGAAAVATAQEKDTITPQPVTLTGCVAAGDKANTYMLSNVVPSAPVGTSGSTAPAAGEMPIYWLDSPSKLKGHVGHKVLITGTLDNDVDKTKVKSEDGKVELKSDGKKVEAQAGTAAANAMPADGMKHVTYKVKVTTVKMIESSCS